MTCGHFGTRYFASLSLCVTLDNAVAKKTDAPTPPAASPRPDDFAGDAHGSAWTRTGTKAGKLSSWPAFLLVNLGHMMLLCLSPLIPAAHFKGSTRANLHLCLPYYWSFLELGDMFGCRLRFLPRPPGSALWRLPNTKPKRQSLPPPVLRFMSLLIHWVLFPCYCDASWLDDGEGADGDISNRDITRQLDNSTDRSART